MNVLSKVKSKIHKAVLGKLIAKKEISRLLIDDDISVRSLAKVFSVVVENDSSHEEKEWIKKIEKVRNRLNATSDRFLMDDHGAGSADSSLAPGEMRQGRVVARSIGEFCQESSKPYKWAFLLFKLIRGFRPTVCLELGTALGISAAYQAAALELNQHGKIVTLEGSASLASLARENFETLGLGRVSVVVGRFQDTLSDVLQENAPIDYVFIDGHHDEQATLAYFRQVMPHLSDGAILVFDDIYWSPGMARAWKTIQKDRSLKVSVDLLSVGICVFTRSGQGDSRYFKIEI